MLKQLIVIFLIFFFRSTILYSQEFSEKKISRDEFNEDVAFLTSKLTTIHPIFLDSAISASWLRYNDSITDVDDDSITLNNCFLRMAPLISVLKDVHSGFFFPYQERKRYMGGKGTTLPFSVTIKADDIYIKQFYSDNRANLIEGVKIKSINSISSKEILLKMHTLHGGKKVSIINSSIERYFGPYFWMFYGEQKAYKLEIITLSRKDSVLFLAPVTMKQYFNLKNKYYPQRKEKKYDLQLIDNNEFAWMIIKSFADNNKLTDFLKLSFDTIAKVNCNNLIIDIRDNFGGNSRCVDSLLNYLTDIKYTQYSSIKLRVSNDVKKRYEKKYPEIYKLIEPVSNDSFFIYPNEVFTSNNKPKLNRFQGNVFLIINEKSYSAAATFTGVVKKYNLGKIIGEETGGTIRYYGDFLVFTLPNTGFRFHVSMKDFTQFGGAISDDGVFPDIKMETGNFQISDILNRCKKIISKTP